MSEALLADIHKWADAVMQRSMTASLQFNQAKGYSSSQICALFFLNDQSQVTINDLAKQLGITKAAVSQMIDRMVQQGLIDRQKNPRDRRRRVLTLTELGKCQVEEARQVRLAWLDDLQKGFTSSQRSKLEHILNILVNEIRQMSLENKQCVMQESNET
ncbi:MAG: MarR family winged helix-turn-helix transcriptional regulator [Anaerolineaceae bacterium]